MLNIIAFGRLFQRNIFKTLLYIDYVNICAYMVGSYVTLGGAGAAESWIYI